MDEKQKFTAEAEPEDIPKMHLMHVLPHEEEREKLGSVSDKQKFNFANKILIGLAIIALCCILSYDYSPRHEVILLDICKTTIPPIATFIIAFYFKK